MEWNRRQTDRNHGLRSHYITKADKWLTKIPPFIHNMACQQKINWIPNKHSPIINIRVSFVRDQITHPGHKQGLERLFVCITSIKHNKNREWKITIPSNACFDFQIKRNEKIKICRKNCFTSSLYTIITIRVVMYDKRWIFRGEERRSGWVKRPKTYWKVNIIKNFFYCILHAPFNSIWLLILCTLPL